MRKINRKLGVSLIVVIASVFISGALFLYPKNLTTDFLHTSKIDTTYNNVRVYIFAGHSDFKSGEYLTFGKQSPEWPDGLKIYEGRSTHDLALRLVLKFRDENIDAQLGNPELRDVSLQERVMRANTLYMLDHRTICIFLHHNAQPTAYADYFDSEGLGGYTSTHTGGATGTEVFTSVGQTASDPIAECIIRELMDVFPDQYFRIDSRDGDLDKEANFYVLYNTYGPAVLIEFLFMTTYSPDCLLLSDYEVREIYLDAIVQGIKNYSNEKY
jgi:N-acetylmuramoyl-L-alanine amidase